MACGGEVSDGLGCGASLRVKSLGHASLPGGGDSVGVAMIGEESFQTYGFTEIQDGSS